MLTWGVFPVESIFCGVNPKLMRKHSIKEKETGAIKNREKETKNPESGTF